MCVYVCLCVCGGGGGGGVNSEAYKPLSVLHFVQVYHDGQFEFAANKYFAIRLIF